MIKLFLKVVILFSIIMEKNREEDENIAQNLPS